MSDAAAASSRKKARSRAAPAKPAPRLRVVQVGAEIFPHVKTGGLGDVMAALPPALARLDVDVRLLLPGYPSLLEALESRRRIASIGPAFGAATIDVLRGELPGGQRAYLLDAPLLYARSGNPYVGPDGLDWPDNPRRFGLLGWAAAHLALGDLDRGWHAEVLHGHDWHAGLAFAYLAQQPADRPASLFTVHNLAFAGPFDPAQLPELLLPARVYGTDGVEFFGSGSFMKAGLFYADRLNTVSPTYAMEIQDAEFGCRFDGLLRRRAAQLSGIVNGIDVDVWDPAHDVHLQHHFDIAAPGGKAQCKAQLQRAFSLRPDPGALLIGVVSRLTQQKGIDLLAAAAPALVAAGLQIVALGSGDAALEHELSALAQAHPQAIAMTIGYDEALAHRIVAGADVIAVPSRYEPCGLTQLYGLRYGSLPVVRRVGGLVDTVVDASDDAAIDQHATGFAFDAATSTALAAALHRAAQLHRDPPRWQQMVQRAMRQDFSWDASARQYLQLYAQLARRA